MNKNPEKDSRPLTAAESWQKYLRQHDWAGELRAAAEVVRNGSPEELAQYLSRNNQQRAEKASARVHSR